MTPTSFTVNWSPAGGTPSPVYITQHRITGNVPWTSNPAGSTAQTFQTINNLQPNTPYDVRVQASNVAGTAFSQVVQQTTLAAVGIVHRDMVGGIEWTAAPVESAQGASLTSTAGSITDAVGAKWTLVSGTGLQVNRNGVAAGSTANVILLLYFNHTIYEENSTSQWQKWNGSIWVATTDPRIAPPTESADGTTLTTTTGTITDATGIAWTLVSATGLEVAQNGVVDATTTNTVTLLYFGHAVYRSNSTGAWFKFASGAWSSIPNDPRIQTILLGATNTITDSTGVVWGLATTNGGQATRNGVLDTTQGSVTELAYVGTTMWRNVGATGLWWSWNGTTWTPPAGTTVSPIGLTRNPWDHPGGNGSVWNTAIGASATFGLATDLDTIAISTSWNGVINASRSIGVASSGPFDTFSLTAPGGQVIRNGVVDATTSNVILLYYTNHTVYQENSSLLWWFWNGTAWISTTDPRAPSPGTAPLQASAVGFTTLTGGAEFDKSTDVTNDISGGTVAPLYNWDGGSQAIPTNGWSIANSILTITAATNHGQGLETLCNTSAPISIGPVSTNGRQTNTGRGMLYRYFYMEASIRFHWQAGPHAAFWTWAYNNGGAPNTLELDIVEVGADSNVFSFWHGHGASGDDGPIGAPSASLNGNLTGWAVPNQRLNKSNSPAAFNKYGLLWTPAKVEWYYNDFLIQNFATNTPIPWSTGSNQTANTIDNMASMALAAILGTWGEQIDIDYLRIWQ